MFSIVLSLFFTYTTFAFNDTQCNVPAASKKYLRSCGELDYISDLRIAQYNA